MDNYLSKKTILVFFIFAAISGAMIFFLAIPILSEIESSGLRVGERRAKIAEYEKRIQAVRAFNAFFKEEKAGFDNIDGVFVNSQIPLDFINFLEFSAKDASVEIEFSSSAAQQQTAKDQPTLNIEASVTGGLNEILRFSKKIESSPYLIEIQNITVETETSENYEPFATTTAAGALGEDASVDVSVPAKAHILFKAYAK